MQGFCRAIDCAEARVHDHRRSTKGFDPSALGSRNTHHHKHNQDSLGPTTARRGLLSNYILTVWDSDGGGIQDVKFVRCLFHRVLMSPDIISDSWQSRRSGFVHRRPSWSSVDHLSLPIGRVWKAWRSGVVLPIRIS